MVVALAGLKRRKSNEQSEFQSMDKPTQVTITVTDGASIPDPRERRLINAWSLAFTGSITTLALLCFFSPLYLDIVSFLPDGLLVTFEVTIFSIICTIPIGILTGLGRLSRNRFINLIASTYVEIIRGIPLLVQLFYIYYALGRFVNVPPIMSAVVAISFCYGAYMGEVVRAGILAVDSGQTEAARSLGFSRLQTLRYVILPQAMRTILPPVGNECIAMLKDTSLVSIIAVADLLRRGREYAAQTFTYFETYTVIALIYLIITLLLSKGVSIMEGRLDYYDNEKR